MHHESLAAADCVTLPLQRDPRGEKQKWITLWHVKDALQRCLVKCQIVGGWMNLSFEEFFLHFGNNWEHDGWLLWELAVNQWVQVSHHRLPQQTVAHGEQGWLYRLVLICLSASGTGVSRISRSESLTAIWRYSRGEGRLTLCHVL